MSNTIPFGSTVQKLTIPRTTLAEGQQGVIVLASNEIQPRYLYYDTSIKRSVRLTPDEAMQLNVTPTLYYFMLVGRLNTDSYGRIVGDQVTLEYLRLPARSYEDLLVQCNNNPNFSCFVVSMDVKHSKQGDFSMLKLTPSSAYQISDAIKATIEQWNSSGKIGTIWGMLDSQISLSLDQYTEMKHQASTSGNDTALQARPGSVAAAPQYISGTTPVGTAVRGHGLPMGQPMGGAFMGGQPMGQSMGQPMGQSVGQPTGQPMGQPMGGAFMGGQPVGQPMGQPMGQSMSGQSMGQPVGQPMGQPANALGVPPSDFDDTFGGTEDGWGDGSDMPF